MFVRCRARALVPRRPSRALALAALGLFAAGATVAQPAEPPPVEVDARLMPHPRLTFTSGEASLWLEGSAQLRPRAELIGPRDLSGGAPATPITQRARAGLGVGMFDHVELRLELQDVRAFGSEVPVGGVGDPTLLGYSAAGLDMHQAWVALALERLWVRVGRQEISLDGQRLVGAVDWTQQARSFDGVRAGYGEGAFDATVFAARVREGSTLLARPEQWLLGAHLAWRVMDALRVAPLVLVDSDDLLPRLRVTTGARLDGGALGFQYDLEGYYQGAQAPEGITSAFLLAARLGYGFDVLLRPALSLFADVLSGDTSPDDASGLSTFDTLYATNHKFYGYQDLFLNIPRDTLGQGLVDAGASLRLGGDALYAEATLHVFSATAPRGDNPLFGVEPDLVLGYRLFPGVALEGGASAFMPIGDALGRGSATTPWAYLQLDARL